MTYEPGATAYLLGIGITAIASVVVAYVTTRKGKRAAGDDRPFTPQESGEHAHTRDVLRQGFKLLAEHMDRRFDLQDQVRGASRQSDQLGLSAKRLEGEGD